MVYRKAKHQSIFSRVLKDRVLLLKWFLLILFLIILSRLFQLQVLQYEEYRSFAEKRIKEKIIPAQRGRILLNDGEGSFFELGSNVSLDLLAADPFLIQERIKEREKLINENPDRAKKFYAPSPAEIAKAVTPLLFSMIKEQSSSTCGGNEHCIAISLEQSFFSEKRFQEEENWKQKKLLDPLFEPPKRAEPEEKALMDEFISDLTTMLSKTVKDQVTLKINIPEETIKKIQELNFTGIRIIGKTVTANPVEIADPLPIALAFEPLLEIPQADLVTQITPRPNRYVKIKNRIDFETAEKIRKLGITGLQLAQERFRHYSEQEGRSFASQVIGFLDHETTPLYGIEKSMEAILGGRKGYIRGEVDERGRALTARAQTVSILEAMNGRDVVLTIDRVIQNAVELLLEEQVKASNARSGEIMVQDPWTGAILAMASYPNFNPNRPGQAYEKEEIQLTAGEEQNLEEVIGKEGKRYFLPLNPGYSVEIFRQGEKKYFRFKNKEGIRVYRNPLISDIYEPGSVFKAIVMASAIDAKEVHPTDLFSDNGPLDVDCHSAPELGPGRQVCDYTIKNSTGKYHGKVTMTQVLEKSLNTGMANVSKKLGPSLMYDFLKNFGFGEKTFIELPDEESGKLPHYRNWISESDMITKAFGQGIAVTPIQLINAFSAVINGGLLMQPTLVSGTLNEKGEFQKNEAHIIRRVISPHASEIMKSMLVSVVERGYGQKAQIAGYKVGGKTGTSQIATKGQYEKGEGSTIASFAGFAPYDHPRFVILIKINRPRSSIWGESNAVPVFNRLAKFLLEYLQVPPESKASNALNP